MNYATVTMQFIASLGAVLAERFYVFQAVRKGFAMKVDQFRQLQGRIAQFVGGSYETDCEIEAGLAWRHAFTVTSARANFLYRI
jgi:hypothetical protein